MAAFILNNLRVALRSIAARFTDERGQDLIEYAVLSGIIAAAIAGAFLLGLDAALAKMATGIANCIDFDKGSSCG